MKISLCRPTRRHHHRLQARSSESLGQQSDVSSATPSDDRGDHLIFSNLQFRCSAVTGFSNTLRRLLCDRTRTANNSVGIRSIFGCVNRALRESAAVLSWQENRHLKLSADDHQAAVGSQTLSSAQITQIPQSATGNSETRCVWGGSFDVACRLHVCKSES